MLIAFFLSALVPHQSLAEPATDVACDQCVGKNDVAGDAITTYKIKDGTVTGKDLADQAVGKRKLKSGAVDWQKLNAALRNRIVDLEERQAYLESQLQSQTSSAQLDALEAEVQQAAEYGKLGLNFGHDAHDVLSELMMTLGLTCAEANYGRFYACSTITAGDGTIWDIDQRLPERALAMLVVDDFTPPPGASPALVFMAQPSGDPTDLLVGGTANFARWPYRSVDDESRLVDDCDSPTMAMAPVWEDTTSSRWRLNGGGYYYVPMSDGQQVATGQMDVTGQTVGIVRNIDPSKAASSESVVWCEMSDQVTGLYTTYELQPYPFRLDEPRFEGPFAIN